ncbi:NUDIX hydrolase [Phaeobacter sp. B1627]|uniref:NUDIX hydrolase n=1 Tax=Phaeobacter sp. B1627 TaxID=2583809 RepID=UPI0011185701|nr:NUDIX hydrolase [Phaeobacter sp. B1627]TNJ48545.1 NUDIX hydrolase [Phaeobacter sp. B1627]
MQQVLHKIWSHTIQPMLSRPRRLQVAALCYRQTQDGQTQHSQTPHSQKQDGQSQDGQSQDRPAGEREVLLITSRDTGRWVLPKGWPMAGKTSAESAAQEAWEEAGVRRGRFEDMPLGRYQYDKRLDNGTLEPLETLVYGLEVIEILDEFPEMHQRTRRWMPAKEAAGLVDEPQLRDLLSRF